MLKKFLSILLLLSLLTACGTTALPASTLPMPSTAPVATPTPTPKPTPTHTPAPTPATTPIPPEKAPEEKPLPTAGTPDQPEEKRLYSLYSWNPYYQTYHSGANDRRNEIWGLLQSCVPVEGAVREEKPIDLLGFLVVYIDTTRESFYCTETQLFSEERGVLKATPEQCKALHSYAKASNAESAAVPQWLRYMNPNSITSATFIGVIAKASAEASGAPTVTDISFTTHDTQQLLSLAYRLSTFQVKADSVVKTSGRLTPETPENLMTIQLTFSSNVVYDIYITDKRLDVMSSDMDYSLSYRPADEDTAEKLRIQVEDIYYQLHPELTPPVRPAPEAESTDPAATEGDSSSAPPADGTPTQEASPEDAEPQRTPNPRPKKGSSR